MIRPGPQPTSRTGPSTGSANSPGTVRSAGLPAGCRAWSAATVSYAVRVAVGKSGSGTGATVAVGQDGGVLEVTLVTLRQVVLDTPDVRGTAEFYRRLLGFAYRPGDETGEHDWLVLRAPDGVRALAFQRVPDLPRPTWPEGPRPQMLHLDLTVATTAALDAAHRRVLELGGRLLADRSGDPTEPLRVYADPAGHPFCVFVAETGPPVDTIGAVRAAHGRLHATLDGLTDEVARRPSRLPGWTVGHVLTHLARNADSVTRRLAAAVEGRVVDQYPGGSAGRAAEIEAGAARPAAELVADLRAADDAVDELFGAVPAPVWGRPVRARGQEVPAVRRAYSRWREVEVHHVDLGLAYAPADWPAGLVERMLPELLAGLPGRAGAAGLAAWLLNRSPAPDLRGWDD